MKNTRKTARTLLRSVVLASVSLTAVAAHAQSAGETRVLMPYTGNISAFTGNISAFTGNISAFTGNISAFTGNISAFSGNISAFTGNISAFGGGVIDPFWGNISAFNTGVGARVAGSQIDYSAVPTWWSTVSPTIQGALTAWSAAAKNPTAGNLDSAQTQLKALQSASSTFWGSAVRAETGKSFDDGFANKLFAKYGIDLAKTNTLGSVSELNRNLFILDWIDGLMGFTGTDQVDWWMKSANWNPALTQVQGGGGSAKIGLLDFQITSDAVAQGDLVTLKGVSNYSNGHGAAVASLMVAPHDGKGVMGIAPRATVIAYNPFDNSATANWSDVTAGVAKLATQAGVLNLSLGVRGWTVNSDWKKVFADKAIIPTLKNTVFVMAAGNDGVSQTANVDLNKDIATANLLIVGSIGPTDQISSFSNRPGTACLTLKCDGGTRLMDRFIVAPGELVLVDDGQGGVTRKIGTSFAAPLVSGAVALLQDRWPWLAGYPKETTSIILSSARDLGALGVDPVYGVGALDVMASQSPLNFDKLQFFSLKTGAPAPAPAPVGAPAPAKTEDAAKAILNSLQSVSTSTVRNTTDRMLAQYDTQGLYYYAFEQVGGTFRDFAIPLSGKLVGQSVMSAGGTQEQFQQYIYARMTDWMTGGDGVIHEADKKGKGYRFTASGDEGVPLANPLGLNLSFAAKPWGSTPLGYRASATPMQTDMRLASKDGRQTLRFGYGDGAAALSGLAGLGLASDSSSTLGGANPILGLASGGAFGEFKTSLTSRLSLSAGVSQKRSRIDLNQLAGQDRLAMKDMADYRSTAEHLQLAYRAAPGLTLTSGWTHLSEPNAMLGVRSTDPNDFSGGSRTDAASIGLEWRPSDGLRLTASGTLGRTSGDGARNAFATDGAMTSSAYQVALDKLGLVDGSDRLRLTFSQPLTVESGRLAYSSVQVTNRATGELGVTTQWFDAKSPERRYVAEMLYAHPVAAGAGEWGLFGRAETTSTFAARQGPEFMAGARYRISY